MNPAERVPTGHEVVIMNDMSEIPSPMMAQPLAYGTSLPPKKSRWKIWLGLGIGGLLLVIAVCAGGFSWLILGGKAEVEPAVEAFLTQVESEDYTGAYNSLGPEWKTKDTQVSFEHLEKVIRLTMGSMQSKTFEGFHIDWKNGKSVAEITYNAIFTKGGGELALTLMKSTGTWKVVGHRVNSPLFVKTLTCPHCKTVQDGMGEYCSKCGKKMPYAQ